MDQPHDQQEAASAASAAALEEIERRGLVPEAQPTADQWSVAQQEIKAPAAPSPSPELLADLEKAEAAFQQPQQEAAPSDDLTPAEAAALDRYEAGITQTIELPQPEAAQQSPALHRVPTETERADFAAKAAALEKVVDNVSPDTLAALQATYRELAADPWNAAREGDHAAGQAAQQAQRVLNPERDSFKPGQQDYSDLRGKAEAAQPQPAPTEATRPEPSMNRSITLGMGPGGTVIVEINTSPRDHGAARATAALADAQQAMQKSDEADKAPSFADRVAARTAEAAAARATGTPDRAPTAAERNATTNQRQADERKTQERSAERSNTSGREGHRGDTTRDFADRVTDRAKQNKEAREAAQPQGRGGKEGRGDGTRGTAGLAFAGFGR